MPVNNGTATPNFGIRVSSNILLSAGVNVSSLAFVNTPVSDNNDFKFTASSPQTLILQNGLSTPASGSQVNLTFKSNVGVVVAGNQTWTLSNPSSPPSVQVDGVLSGAGTLTLAGNSSNLATVTLNGHDTNSGGINANGVSLFIAQSDSLGTGALALANSSNLIATAGMTVANAITLNGSLGLQGKGGTLTLTGPVTLTGATSINTQPTPTSATQPVVISGNIGGAFALGKSGTGNLFLTGTNSFSGANVNGGGLVFGSAGSVSGTVSVANNTYAGLAFTSGNVTTDFANFAKGTSGAVGYDTAPGAAGTLTINTPINLLTAGFTNTSLRFGTATNLILGSSATLTPTGPNYLFAGASNGTLTIQSALTGTRQLQLLNVGAGPMHLYLQGANSYTGGTLVSAGTLVFDASGAVPASGLLNASSSSAYIGQTENTGTTDAAFVGQFNSTTFGVIGFDSHTPATPRTVDVTGISFTRFGSGAAIGTSTALTLTGTLTSPAASGLRLATANGGALTVNSILGSSLGTVTLANVSSSPSGTITLNGNNTYSAGTNLSGGVTVTAGSANAFGTGAITAFNNNTAKLTTSGTFTLPNAIILGTGSFDTLQIGGTNNFTLGGVISGGSSSSGLTKVDANTLTLTGANTYSGPTTVFGGVLQLLNDSATGLAALSVQSGASVQFATSNPTVYGITVDSDSTVSLAGGSTLTVSTPSSDSKIHGTLTGNGSTLNLTGGKALTLDGTTTGINAMNVTNGAALIGSSTGLNSSATITVNATGVGAKAGVGMTSGVTLSNPITLTSGILLGYGTFTPSNGTLTIGPNIKLYPGATLANDFPGRLSFGNGLNFASGGDYEWGVVDANPSTGTFSSVGVTGGLAISATSGSPFTLKLTSYDAQMNTGMALNFNSGQSYQWSLVSATSGITGFVANAFTIDGSGFQNPLNGGAFSLTANTNNLFLNFTPVPEPPEYALLATGAAVSGGLWLTGQSRRKARPAKTS